MGPETLRLPLADNRPVATGRRPPTPHGVGPQERGAPRGRRPPDGGTPGGCLTWRGYLTGLLLVVASLCCREWTNLWTTVVALMLCAVFLRQLQVARVRSARTAPRQGLQHQSPHRHRSPHQNAHAA